MFVCLTMQAKPIDPITQAVLNAYDKMLSEDPGDYNTLYERAMQYYQLEQYSQALDDVDRALRITPENGRAAFMPCRKIMPTPFRPPVMRWNISRGAMS